MGRERRYTEKLILSLFDYSGAWAKPWIDTGYPVMLFDKKIEGDILDFDILEDWISGYEEFVYGIIAAPPCTEFAVSGARWWEKKDKEQPELLETAMNLISVVTGLVESGIFPNLKFWCLENPVGRLERVIPEMSEYRMMTFHPCDFGDTYKKRTVLYGMFNTNLPKQPVEPVIVKGNGWQGSYHMRLGGKSERTKTLRSITPSGFARAFFIANRYNPSNQLRLAV